MEALIQRSRIFSAFESRVPILCATDMLGPNIHRFYDTSPISPSGRYIAVTELPSDDRLPAAGDMAKVAVISLSSGAIVFECLTAAWDTQVGAHVQWGSSDDELYFNKVDAQSWKPYGVKANIFEAQEVLLSQPVYMVSNSGDTVASPTLEKITLCQAGYGINVPDPTNQRNIGAPADDGLFLADTKGGPSRLVISLKQAADVIAASGDELNLVGGALYGFHVKWSPNDEKLMFIVRWLSHSNYQRGTKNYLLTANNDGSDLHLALGASRWAGGHHPNWHPDSTRIIMNLRDRSAGQLKTKVASLLEKLATKLGFRFHSGANPMRFYLFKFDGTHLTQVAPASFGSGHPTIDASGTHILTDAYQGERVAERNGTVPLRWINTTTGKELTLAMLDTTPPYTGEKNELRVDPHPAWHKSGRFIAFNACVNGTRRVFVADMSSLVSPEAL